MGDAGKFSNDIIYWIFNVLCIMLIFSEIILLLVTFIRRYRQNKKGSDKGSMWFVIVGFWSSIFFPFFFRSIRFSDSAGKWLLPDIFTYVGVICIIAGMIVRWISIVNLNRAFTFLVQTSKEQHLITNGMYKLVRNPAYSGSILSLFGIALSLRNILSIIVVILICFICYGIRIRIEEQALRKAFGSEFDVYCKSTKRLIPYIW